VRSLVVDVDPLTPAERRELANPQLRAASSAALLEQALADFHADGLRIA
jgi:hypothetical protein